MLPSSGWCEYLERVARLTRIQQQEKTRSAVLVAAHDEFAAHGFAEAKVDRIADRAELTRGAVYSNFPSKRALYLAVLREVAAADATLTGPADLGGGTGVPSTVEAFARVWLERLPMRADSTAGAALRLRSLTGVFDGSRGREALEAVARLETLLLALALEARGAARRRVRLAELVLTLLDGACHRAEFAPGSVDPFDVARACGHLAGLPIDDVWDPPHRPYVTPAVSLTETWEPPPDLPDLITGEPVPLGADGLLMVLGTGRLGAAEEAVRSGEPVTVAIATEHPAELGALAELRVRDLAAALRRVLPGDAWPAFRLVLDRDRTVASALGLTTDDLLEAGVRVDRGRLLARGVGRGAGLAVAAAG